MLIHFYCVSVHHFLYVLLAVAPAAATCGLLQHLPSSLLKLSCKGCTSFTQLPQLPEQLTSLQLPNNYKDTLPKQLPSGLTSLRLTRQSADALPELQLPTSLQELKANESHSLTQLPKTAEGPHVSAAKQVCVSGRVCRTAAQLAQHQCFRMQQLAAAAVAAGMY
jgi:hypothetical protein